MYCYSLYARMPIRLLESLTKIAFPLRSTIFFFHNLHSLTILSFITQSTMPGSIHRNQTKISLCSSTFLQVFKACGMTSFTYYLNCSQSVEAYVTYKKKYPYNSGLFHSHVKYIMYIKFPWFLFLRTQVASFRS